MWRLKPQGGDFFRKEKYYPALDRPQATADGRSMPVLSTAKRKIRPWLLGWLCPRKKEKGEQPLSKPSAHASASTPLNYHLLTNRLRSIIGIIGRKKHPKSGAALQSSATIIIRLIF